MGLSLLSTSFPIAFQSVFHRPLLFDPTEPLDAELLADTERQIPNYNLRGEGVTINAKKNKNRLQLLFTWKILTAKGCVALQIQLLVTNYLKPHCRKH